MVFVSHASADLDIARTLVRQLEEDGLECWLDDKMSSPGDPNRLMPGQHYDLVVMEAMQRAGVMLILVSHAAAQSDYVGLELTTARLQGTPIVAVLLDDVSVDNLGEHLKLSDLRIKWLSIARARLSDEAPAIAQALHFHLAEARRKSRHRTGLALVTLSIFVSVLFLSFRGLQSKESSLPAAVDYLLHARESSGRSIGEVKVRLDLFKFSSGDSQWLPLMENDVLASGQIWAAEVAADLGGWLYVFQQDGSGKVQWLHPRNEFFADSSGSNPVQPGSLISIPGNDVTKGLVLDDTTGRERVFAIVSAARDAALERALSSAVTETNHAPIQPDVEQQLVMLKGSVGAMSTGVRRVSNRGASPGTSTSIQISGRVIESRSGWIFENRSFQHVPMK